MSKIDKTYNYGNVTDESSEYPESCALPIPKQQLFALFDYLLGDAFVQCNGTMDNTAAFLRQRGHDVEPTLTWLNHHGACCDGAVLENVAAEMGYVCVDDDGEIVKADPSG